MRLAIFSALEHWASGARPRGGRFAFEFDWDVGEGYSKGGGALVRTRFAVVVIRGGEVVTAFPSLKATSSDDAGVIKFEQTHLT